MSRMFLAAGDERFLMVNNMINNNPGRVLSSTDGTKWQVIEDLPPWNSFNLVEATPFGFYAGKSSGSVWASPDGVDWNQLPDETFPGGLSDIAGSQSGLVAVTLKGRVFHSPDGAAWTEVLTLQSPPADTLNCPRVGASEVGFLVVFRLEGPSGTLDSGVPAAWFSEDGRVWSRVPTNPQANEPDSGSVPKRSHSVRGRLPQRDR